MTDHVCDGFYGAADCSICGTRLEDAEQERLDAEERLKKYYANGHINNTEE